MSSVEKPRLELAKAVIKRDGKCLLLKRALGAKHYPDLWDFPGGKLEEGEAAVESVVREVKEETGFDINPGEEVKDILYEDTGHWLHFHYFVSKSVSGKLQLSDAHSEHMWATENDIKDLVVHSAVSEYLK